jgi:hypothetical protein
MIEASPGVERVGRELREKRVMPSSRCSVVWQWGRARTARDLRRRPAKASPAEPLECVAVMGAAGIADEELWQIFEIH